MILIRLIKFFILYYGEPVNLNSFYFNSAADLMSMTLKLFLFAAVLLTATLSLAAQDSEVSIKITANAPTQAIIEGKLLRRTAVDWSFVNAATGAENLAMRRENLQLFDDQNLPVEYKKLAAGEYPANRAAVKFSYCVNLAAPDNERALAHVSWLANNRGILMIDDLLPRFADGSAAQITFDLPPDWKIISGARKINAQTFAANAESIFAVGADWREVENQHIKLAITGEWKFTDAEAAQTASEIFAEYEKLFGASPPAKPQIILARFPPNITFGRWEAETRRANVTIVSADMPFKTQSIQRLHEQMRHEIFHLWLPKNVNLAGDYSWFYEGFTVYQALKTGVAVNRLRFADFLDTLSEAYNADNFSAPRALFENGQSDKNKIYTRGMIAAFLCDVALLSSSKGKFSIADVFREVYQKHRFPNARQDGSTAILKILKSHKELVPIVENYIEAAAKIDWNDALQAIGVEAFAENSRTKLRVAAKLNGRRKDLLNRLGYNNWRKPAE